MNWKHGGISHKADILCFFNTQNVHSIEPSQTCVLLVTRAQVGEVMIFCAVNLVNINLSTPTYAHIACKGI